MQDFLSFFNDIAKKYHFNLEIYYSETMDWCISIYKKDCIDNITQDCDMELCFAKAQAKLKEWLSENKGGY